MGNLEEISVSLPIFCQIFPVFPSLPQHQSGFNRKRRKGVGSTWRKGWGGTMREIDLLRSCWEHKNKGKSGNSKPQFLWGACPALSLLPIGISAQKKKKKNLLPLTQLVSCSKSATAKISRGKCWFIPGVDPEQDQRSKISFLQKM